MGVVRTHARLVFDILGRVGTNEKWAVWASDSEE